MVHGAARNVNGVGGRAGSLKISDAEKTNLIINYREWLGTTDSIVIVDIPRIRTITIQPYTEVNGHHIMTISACKVLLLDPFAKLAIFHTRGNPMYQNPLIS